MKFIPVAAFTAFSVKALLVSPSLYEVLAIGFSACLVAYFYFIDESKRVNKHVNAQNIKIEALEKMVLDHKATVENLQSGINQLKTAFNFRAK